MPPKTSSASAATWAKATVMSVRRLEGEAALRRMNWPSMLGSSGHGFLREAIRELVHHLDAGGPALLPDRRHGASQDRSLLRMKQFETWRFPLVAVRQWRRRRRERKLACPQLEIADGKGVLVRTIADEPA